MKETPHTAEAYDLLHQGAQALAVVEASGLRVDEAYLRHAMRRVRRQISVCQEELEQSEVWGLWRKRFGGKANLGSDPQLVTVLFDEMGLPSPPDRTATGRHKADAGTLEKLDHPFVVSLRRMRTLKRALATHLQGLAREVVGGYVHPFFNLHTVSTYRSSCDSPNMQNVPIRDKTIKDLVRRAIVARPGGQLVELDFKGLEVSISACYHRDPTMIDYLCDPSKDLHRDMAMELYKLRKDQVSPEIRYCGKSSFVFPQFYGDYYVDCARALWNSAGGISLTDGIPLRDHLEDMGYDVLGACDPRQDPVQGTFEYHVKRVEKRFWEKRFPVYARWKKDWYEGYCRRGFLEMLTGFVCQGFMKRNEIINYPIQGSAFHCLLWSLIRLVLRELKRCKMETLVVGQVHDSILADVPVTERADYIELARDVLTRMLPRRWPWIIVPLEVEVEVTPPGGSWAEKQSEVEA